MLIGAKPAVWARLKELLDTEPAFAACTARFEQKPDAASAVPKCTVASGPLCDGTYCENADGVHVYCDFGAAPQV